MSFVDDKMNKALSESQLGYNAGANEKNLNLSITTSGNTHINVSHTYGHGLGINTSTTVIDNSKEKYNQVNQQLSHGLLHMGVLGEDSKKALQTGVSIFQTLGVEGNFTTDNDFSGGKSYLEKNMAGLSVNLARGGGGAFLGGVSAQGSYKNLTGSMGVGSNGIPNISVYGTFGADNDTSRSGLKFDAGGRIPASLVFDIHWSHNGKSYTFPLGSLLTPPQGILYAGQAIFNNIKTLFGERNGAEYEAIAADTRPMKEPYRELTDMDKDTGDVKLNEQGKAVAAQIAKNMLDNPTAKFYMGAQDKKQARSEKEQVVFMSEIQTQLQEQYAQRQQAGYGVSLDLNSIQKNIEIGHPPKTDKEIISANYANVLIVNNGVFQANGNVFQGLTSVAAKNAEKEISQSPEWQEIVKTYGIKGNEEKQAMRLILTTSNAINGDSQFTPAQVIGLLGSKVYGQGLTMEKIYEEQNFSTHMKRFQDSPEFKAVAEKMDLTQIDKDLLSKQMIENSINNPNLNMAQLAEIGGQAISGKTEKDFKDFVKGSEKYFAALATSPNPVHQMVGNLYSCLGESSRLAMSKNLLASFKEQTNLDIFPDMQNASHIAALQLSEKQITEYVKMAHFVDNPSLNGGKIMKFLSKPARDVDSHYLTVAPQHWEAYQELAAMPENARDNALQKLIAKNPNSDILTEKYGLKDVNTISVLAGSMSKNYEKLAQDTLAYQQQFNDPSASVMLAKLHPNSNQPQIAQAEQVSPSVAAMAQNNQAPAPNVQPEIQQQQAVMEQQQNRPHEMGMS